MTTDSFVISLNVEILLSLICMNKYIQRLEQMPPPFSNSEILQRAKNFYQNNIVTYDKECIQAQEAVRNLLKNDTTFAQRFRNMVEKNLLKHTDLKVYELSKQVF